MVKKKLKKAGPKLSGNETTAKELATAIATEARPRVRKRLIALNHVLAGNSPTAAGRSAGASRKSVAKWVALANGLGWRALTRDKPKPVVQKILDAGVTPDEVKSAYEAEIRPLIRKRLLALHAVLSGHSHSSAARVARLSDTSVAYWIAKAARLGWQALTVRREAKNGVLIDGAKAATARIEIGRLLAEKIEADERRRFECVLRVLDGEDPRPITKEKDISLGSLQHWLRMLCRHGASSLLNKPHHSKIVLEDDPETLRAMATQEADPRAAKALRALALVAEGRNTDEAGWHVNVHPTTVGQWAAAYRKSGVDGLRIDRSKCCRPSKLSPQQKSDLAVILKTGSNMSWREIWQIVRVGFGVHYSMQGLMRLVREDLEMQLPR